MVISVGGRSLRTAHRDYQSKARSVRSSFSFPVVKDVRIQFSWSESANSGSATGGYIRITLFVMPLSLVKKSVPFCVWSASLLVRICLHCTLGELLGRTHFGAATYRFSALPLALAVFDCSICLCHNFVEVFNFKSFPSVPQDYIKVHRSLFSACSITAHDQ